MKYEYWLAGIRQLSARKKILLRKYLNTGKAIYNIEEKRLDEIPFLNEKDRKAVMLAKSEVGLDEKYEKMEEQGIHFIPFFSEEYPQKLRQIPDPAYAIYVKGKFPRPDMPSVAIVGARNCTPYGEKYATDFGRELAENGVQIISGLARGIDGFGQRGALIGQGRTFAVLGCGADICYPREHIGLYMDILEQEGGILSEYQPGTPPLPANFPMRNRIISGLSDIILVIEARERSGSLITADMALEQGKDVYALPGPINSGQSQGCNKLIHQGAGILLSTDMLLEDLSITPISRKCTDEAHRNVHLSEKENAVYSKIGFYPKSINTLLDETDIRAGEMMELLVSLELQGYIREVSKNHYVLGK